MAKKQLLLPASFPKPSPNSVRASAASNNDDTYSIQYQTSTGEPLAHVVSSRFSSKQEAVEEIESFEMAKKWGTGSNHPSSDGEESEKCHPSG